MADQADVKSIDTLAFVRTAFASFAHETGQALAEIEIQGQRAVDWICVDQAAYWKMEIRKANEVVNKAIKDLEHCRTFKKVGDTTPSCIEEKKALEKARQKLARAEGKAEAVRRWTPIVQQQFRETGVRLVRFRDVIDVDCPRAMSQLEKMLRALDAYRQAASPTGPDAAGSGSAGPSVTRQLEEPAPARQADGVEQGERSWRVCDLSSGASKLANALKQINLKWDAATETWNDARAKAFHKENVDPLLPSVKETLDALGRLAEVLDPAARDVSDSDGI